MSSQSTVLSNTGEERVGLTKEMYELEENLSKIPSWGVGGVRSVVDTRLAESCIYTGADLRVLVLFQRLFSSPLWQYRVCNYGLYHRVIDGPSRLMQLGLEA
jgi:hypothetical protein